MSRYQKIMDRIKEHYEEALKLFPADRIVGVFLQGSQNYMLDHEGSDIDTKCIVLPTLEDLIFNRKPVSTTHVMENDEHLDLKDLRLYFQTFRNQNVNFLEILFTDYKIVNPIYKGLWDELVEHNEEIARYNEVKAIKTMKGIAMEKYHAMEHRYPSKAAIIDKWGYDGKQLSHLIRVRMFLQNYIKGTSYEDCLIPNTPEYLIKIKVETPKGFYYNLEQARDIAREEISWIQEIYDNYISNRKETKNLEVDEFLDDIQRSIMKKAIDLELRKG